MEKKFLKQKGLLGLFLLSIVPLIVTGYYLASVINRGIRFARKEKSGLEYNLFLREALEQSQNHRSLMSISLSQGTASQEKLITTQFEIEDTLKKVEAISRKLGKALEITNEPERLKGNWKALKSTLPQLQSEKNFELHTAFITDILSIISYVGDTSNLILDPDLDSYYLMKMVVVDLPMLTEYLDQARALGVVVAAHKAISLDEKNKLLILSGKIKMAIEDSQRSIAVISRENPRLKEKLGNPIREAIGSTEAFLRLLMDRLINANNIDVSPSGYFAIATGALQSHFKLYDIDSLLLDQLLQRRIDKFSFEKYKAGIFILFMVLVVSYVFWAFARVAAKRKHAEEQSHKLSIAIEQSPSTVMIIDRKGNIEYVNSQFVRLTGYSAVEVIGKNPSILQSDKTPPEVYDDIRKTVAAGKVWHGETYNVKKNGALFWGEEFITALKDAEGNITHFIIVGEDITERKQKEAELREAYSRLKETQTQLIQAEKLEVIGRLASGVAHEVKNPLAILMQGIDFFSRKLPQGDENFSVTLRYMSDAVKRADTIVKELLDFSGLSTLERGLYDLNSVIDESLSLLKYELDKRRTKIVKDFTEGLPKIEIDKNRIEQVFVNLVLNAIQAMGVGGELRAMTYAEGLDTGERHIIAEIVDSGPGIPEDILGKIFDPFFTTKRNIAGTGLGLSIVRNIIELHNAKIDIKNREDTSGVRALVSFKG